MNELTGQFPADWELLRLPEVLFFQEGPGITSDKFTKEGIPFINIRCFVNGRIDRSSCQFISQKLGNGEYKHFQLDVNDWVFSSSGTIGKIALIFDEDLPLLLNTSTIRFRTQDEKRLANNYIKFFLESFHFKIQHQLQTQGSAQVNVGPTHLQKMHIPLPPIKEQTQIATILSTIDRAIEQTEALIAKQQRIKTGLMQDLLTKGIDENGNIRSEETHEFKDSPLGRIPVEWEVESLDELTTKIGDGIHTTPAYSENTGFFFINGNNLGDGSIHITSDTLCVNQGEFRKYYIELDDRTILYSINGTIGNIAFYKNEPVVLGKSAAYIKCKKSVNARLIYHILQSEPVHRFYDYELTGSTIKNLSLAAMRATPIKIPRMQEEQEFLACRLDLCVYEIGQANNCLSKLRSLKTGLMQDLLTGKVRVTDLLNQKTAAN
ncbi:MAG: restriction endonuclease subunit S [Microcystis sp. Msp_OC_L_20101000_S702]|uniref:restriction endonuclease subunit S n=1 Tax=Microcystis sp. Msp_OC_L_20101000_S702 TaxID=2486218 RepID=UPI00118EBC1F|nr:restriction endonuclease subunit S [Microcystis sp. Msp_OC_L_20101000_S702]TRU14244.1 MAG: restriction endonuclease subunit S [Microcystis sp. Msp_OC_L_20101000_S702]